MKINIKNEVDYLVAQTKAETKIAEEIVESIRKTENYYEEKLISVYAEAKTNYPILAELMENKRPYLKDLLAEAKKLYEKSILG